MLMRVLTDHPARSSNAAYASKKVQREFSSFRYWLDVMGPAPSELHSIDRINPNGHYEEGNIRWMLLEENMKQPRRYRK